MYYGQILSVTDYWFGQNEHFVWIWTKLCHLVIYVIKQPKIKNKEEFIIFFKEENVVMLYWSSFMSLLYCWQSKASILLISFVSRFIAIWFYKLLVQNNSTKSTRLTLSVLFTFYREITVQIEGNIADIKGR